MVSQTTMCPGCGLEMPSGPLPYDRKFHASAECWAVFEQVLATEYQNAVLFGQVHQMTVDTYAVQHAGGRHPDKSVCVHFVGLYLELERGIKPTVVPPHLQRLASRTTWPHLAPPPARTTLTVRDVAQAESPTTHAQRVREWATQVWQLWTPHHQVARDLARALF